MSNSCSSFRKGWSEHPEMHWSPSDAQGRMMQRSLDKIQDFARDGIFDRTNRLFCQIAGNGAHNIGKGIVAKVRIDPE